MISNINNPEITIIGAGGKMGMRLLNNLSKKNYNLFTCEISKNGIERIKEKGFEISNMEKIVPLSDFIILAIPDVKIFEISKKIIPIMKEKSTVIILDPAAAFAKKIFLRDDCTFVVTHPCHPELFYFQKTKEARSDMFGGVAAEQNIIIALLQGDESNFKRAEKICRDMFSPVLNAFRITVEQMVLLEPAAVEVLSASCLSVIRESLDELVRRGVPKETAEAFMFGHLNIELAILFKSTNPFSDAALKAIKYGRKKIFKKNWKNIFKEESINEVLEIMLNPNS